MFNAELSPTRYCGLWGTETPGGGLVEVLLSVHRNRRLIRDGEPRTSTSTFTQLLNSVGGGGIGRLYKMLQSPPHFPVPPGEVVCLAGWLVVGETCLTASCLRRGTGGGPRSQEVREEGDSDYTDKMLHRQRSPPMIPALHYDGSGERHF